MTIFDYYSMSDPDQKTKTWWHGRHALFPNDFHVPTVVIMGTVKIELFQCVCSHLDLPEHENNGVLIAVPVVEHSLKVRFRRH